MTPKEYRLALLTNALGGDRLEAAEILHHAYGHCGNHHEKLYELVYDICDPTLKLSLVESLAWETLDEMTVVREFCQEELE